MIAIDKTEKLQTAMIKRCRSMIIPLITLVMPSMAFAAPVTVNFRSLDFSSTNQGMWGSGSAPGLNIDRFIGTSWNSSTSVGKIRGKLSSTTLTWPHWHWPSGWECHGFLCHKGHYHNPGHTHTHSSTLTADTRSGARADVNTSGRVGFQFGLQADSGSVNADVQFDASLLVPDAASLNVGDFFNLNPSNTLAGGQLATNFPNISANLDAIVGVRASIDNAQICGLGFGCSAKASSGQLGFPDQTVPLVSFNQPSSPGQIKVLGLLDPGAFQFDNPITIKNKLNLTIHIPDITTTAGVSGNKLMSSGADNLFTLTADLDTLALAPAGVPNGANFEKDIGIVNVSGDLIDVQMGPVLTIKQNFEYNPSLYVNLSFDNPVFIAGKYASPTFHNEIDTSNPFTRVCFQSGPSRRTCISVPNFISVQDPLELAPQTSWSGRWDQLPDIALISPDTLVTPTFSVQGDLLNNTLLGIDGLFQLDILQATVALKNFGLNFELGSVGPLYNYTRQSNLFDTPPLFSQSFGLGGFNSIAGNSFMVRAAGVFGKGVPVFGAGNGTSVPEPAPMLLLLFGLIAIGLSRRKSARECK